MACNKIPYETRSKAKSELRQLKMRGRHEFRVYFCKPCNAFHLTSKRPNFNYRGPINKEIPQKEAEWLSTLMQLRSIQW